MKETGDLIFFGENTFLDLKRAHATVETLLKDKVGFSKLAELLRSISGIYLELNQHNLNLMAGHLSLKMVSLNLNTYQDYYTYITQNKPDSENEFVQLMTINATHFFREPNHYKILRNHLPEIIKSKSANFGSELKVWCSASSTGQEPYSILISILETFPNFTNKNLIFYATDIDQAVLAKAAIAEYDEAEISSLPTIYRLKYFDFISNHQSKNFYTLKEQFRRLIRFQQLNLLDSQQFFKNTFDIIFCRNVLIYFQKKDCDQVINRLIMNLAPRGLLFLSHSEGGLLKNSQVQAVGPAVYPNSIKK